MNKYILEKKINFKGAFFMILSAASFAAAHAGVRELSDEVHPFATALYRNVFGILFLLPWLLKKNFAVIRLPLRSPIERERFKEKVGCLDLSLIQFLCFIYSLNDLVCSLYFIKEIYIE